MLVESVVLELLGLGVFEPLQGLVYVEAVVVVAVVDAVLGAGDVLESVDGEPVVEVHPDELRADLRGGVVDCELEPALGQGVEGLPGLEIEVGVDPAVVLPLFVGLDGLEVLGDDGVDLLAFGLDYLVVEEEVIEFSLLMG